MRQFIDCIRDARLSDGQILQLSKGTGNVWHRQVGEPLPTRSGMLEHVGVETPLQLSISVRKECPKCILIEKG